MRKDIWKKVNDILLMHYGSFRTLITDGIKWIENASKTVDFFGAFFRVSGEGVGDKDTGSEIANFWKKAS